MSTVNFDDELARLLTEARSKGHCLSKHGTSWTEKDLLQLAQKLDLGLERTTVLLIKHRWTAFAGKRERRATDQDVDVSVHKCDFDPDPAGLFDMLQGYDGLPSANGYSPEDFRDLVRTAILNDIHMVSIRSQECEYFVEGIRVGRKVLQEGDTRARERFCEARGRWILRCEEQGDLLLSLANQELANARVNQEFMLTYGSTYIELEELAHTANSLRTRIRLKEANPDLTATELDDLSEIDIGIMPLPDEDWARGKCGLKALQYMALEIPTVCSPVGVNTEIIEDGVNGFLAKNEKEWIEKLSLLIENQELRGKTGCAGRKTVEERYSVKANASKYLDILQKVYQSSKNTE